MVYEDMKQRYGPQGCALLKINSRPISADNSEQIPDPWCQYLNTNYLSSQVNVVALLMCRYHLLFCCLQQL